MVEQESLLRLYDRTASFFELSPLKANGAPPADELALLEPMRDRLRPEVFGEAVLPPVSDGSGQDRRLLREASRLLDEAGGRPTARSGACQGETLAVEFLIDSPIFERILGPYVKNLKLLGVDATIRTVDEAQYQDRLKTFDFDMISSRFFAAA